MRIGVDVGGTNTDAVLMDGMQVLGWAKASTTADVSSGIRAAITSVLNKSSIDTAGIRLVMIGTTHFTNAFVERKRLLPVGVIRLSLPAGRGVPPLADWPHDLRERIGGHVYELPGGYQYDGRVNAPIDEQAIAEAARAMRAGGITTVAISGVFSHVDAAQEIRAAEIVAQEIPDVSLSLSHRIGRLGLLERENAAVMNASLADLSRTVVQSFGDALDALGIAAPFFISQNDGTLMNADTVRRYPVLTFASGPTNSMRGAAYLSGLKNAIVADIGGTTTDIGMLVNGFPRESSVTVDIGGVRTNFRMPDVLSIGLGGGSIVRNDAGVSVGPDSVGYRLITDALVFGGDTLTTSDIAVAAGHAEMGDPSRVAHLPAELVERAMEAINAKVEEAADRMRTSAESLPLILVGGGAVLVSRDIAGVSRVIRPDHASVANAIGAAIAQVSGEVDRVFSYEVSGRDAAIATAKQEAVADALAAGASSDSVEIVDIEEVPLAYVPGGAVRLRVRAVGDLAVAA